MPAKQLTTEQILLLKKPLPKEAVKPHPTKTFLSSIKAIYVVERLNEVFGIGGWYTTNEVVREDGKMIVVKSTFEAPDYGIKIPDVFGGNDNADLGDAYKGACTDALTKIGSYMYIGMDVYKGLADKGEKKSEKEIWLDKIEDCKTLDELKKVFESGGKIFTKYPELVAAKDNKKTQLSK